MSTNVRVGPGGGEVQARAAAVLRAGVGQQGADRGGRERVGRERPAVVQGVEVLRRNGHLTERRPGGEREDRGVLTNRLGRRRHSEPITAAAQPMNHLPAASMPALSNTSGA